MTDRRILDDFAQRAANGDGQFAIAYAILTLANEHRRLQENLTFGEINDPNRTPGAFEKMAMVMEDISAAIGTLRRDDE